MFTISNPNLPFGFFIWQDDNLCYHLIMEVEETERTVFSDYILENVVAEAYILAGALNAPSLELRPIE